jgi:hypothetical protein
MALITLPAKFSFTNVEKFGLTRHSNTLRSRYTGQAQRVVYPYAVWEFAGKLVEYDGPEAAAIRAFLIDLEGVQNKFQLPVPGYTKPSTGITYNARNLGAKGERQTTLSMKGLTVELNKPFLAKGDYFTINDELKMATESVSTDANGIAVVNFKPATRKAVADDAPVILQNPYCLMHAVEDDVASWGLAPPIRHGINFKAIEAVEI